jgi:hypothetical protein
MSKYYYHDKKVVARTHLGVILQGHMVAGRANAHANQATVRKQTSKSLAIAAGSEQAICSIDD